MSLADVMAFLAVLLGLTMVVFLSAMAWLSVKFVKKMMEDK